MRSTLSPNVSAPTQEAGPKTTSLTLAPRIACPDWCIADHSEDGARLTDPNYVIVHDGQPETFPECAVRFSDEAAAPVVIFPTLSQRADGTELRAGMMLGGRICDEADLRALVTGLAHGLNA